MCVSVCDTSIYRSIPSRHLIIRSPAPTYRGIRLQHIPRITPRVVVVLGVIVGGFVGGGVGSERCFSKTVGRSVVHKRSVKRFPLFRAQRYSRTTCRQVVDHIVDFQYRAFEVGEVGELNRRRSSFALVLAGIDNARP
ncbi:MAG: hypothetical protein UY41_C0057G0009 [Candidatus Moranbacteria bacterium GW2011_GWE1_49_15]|nr:MAG: hypothetical protein UY41_C0057G0009 [Candidatus Moranbacteria bacterium GW2011_GWE1_49_15]